jgi:hypothetical protein
MGLKMDAPKKYIGKGYLRLSFIFVQPEKYISYKKTY